VKGLPVEARAGVMRVWVEILKERHPGVAWVPALPEAVAQGAVELLESDGEQTVLAA
jgi:hypothetical protein